MREYPLLSNDSDTPADELKGPTHGPEGNTKFVCVVTAFGKRSLGNLFGLFGLGNHAFNVVRSGDSLKIVDVRYGNVIERTGDGKAFNDYLTSRFRSIDTVYFIAT